MLDRYFAKRLGHVASAAKPAKPPAVHIVFLMTAGAGPRLADLASNRFAVAHVALQPLVGAVQPELGFRIVVELPEGPSVGVVARPTFGAEAAFMLVVLLMTTEALTCSVFVGGREVTLFARSDSVQPDEGEAAQVMIEEHLRLPTALVVTPLTLFPLLPLVWIRLLMTAVARRPQLLLVKVTGVTRVALHLAMFVFERVLRLVVVEERVLPLFEHVARLTLGTVSPLVSIILVVASDARCPGFLLVAAPLVARGARCLTVLFFEGEPGFVVIEKGRLPTLQRVAVAALLSVPTFVLIVVLVAGKADGI
jgi:hypothetical protein